MKNLLSWLFGAAGQSAGGVVNTATLVAAIAALAPLALWFTHHKDDVLLAVTYGQAAFWGSLIFGLVAVILKVAHYARPPGA